MDPPDDRVDVAPASGALHSGWWLRVAPYVVSLALVVVFALLAALSRAVADDNELRLLQQQTDQAAAALEVSIGQVKTPLESMARAIPVAGEDPAVFARLAEPLLAPGSVYDRTALFRIDDPTPQATIGGPLVISEDPAAVDDLLHEARTEPFLIVNMLRKGRTLGYAVVDDPSSPTYIVYAERTLSADPNVRRRFDEPFSTIDYALYLDGEEDDEALLGASVRETPIEGRRAETTVAFGNTELLLTTTPKRSLGSDLLRALWWIILAGGGVVSAAAGLLLARLGRHRQQAVGLAREIERLYRQEQDVAKTLQLALLPERLEPPPGCQLAVRYWPADVTNLVGGDFYDVFATNDGRWFAVIGDVCGHGIEAAAVTGMVRHTLRGAAQHVSSPREMLLTIHRALATQQAETFCTVCLVALPTESPGLGDLVISLGGHPPPLLRRRDGSVETVGTTGLLLGMIEPNLQDAVVPIEPGDTLLLYTDGFTDAPGTRAFSIDEMTSLLETSGDLEPGPLADAIRAGQRHRQPGGSDDDTALVIIRFGVANGGAEVAASRLR